MIRIKSSGLLIKLKIPANKPIPKTEPIKNFGITSY